MGSTRRDENGDPTNQPYNKGGLGGYAMGYVALPMNTNVYVYVGGQGVSSGNDNYNFYTSGGYNGGGNGQDGGGGATHISKVKETLPTIGAKGLTYAIANVYIVAGGGGGADTGDWGGAGGGTNGGDSEHGWGKGGSQTAGGQFLDAPNTDIGNSSLTDYTGSNGSLGKGGTEEAPTENPSNSGKFVGVRGAGGGGWYGGSTSKINGDYGGGGGSGYIGGVSNGTMNTPAWQNEGLYIATDGGVREGNGYARITLTR